MRGATLPLRRLSLTLFATIVMTTSRRRRSHSLAFGNAAPNSISGRRRSTKLYGAPASCSRRSISRRHPRHLTACSYPLVMHPLSPTCTQRTGPPHFKSPTLPWAFLSCASSVFASRIEDVLLLAVDNGALPVGTLYSSRLEAFSVPATPRSTCSECDDPSRDANAATQWLRSRGSTRDCGAPETHEAIRVGNFRRSDHSVWKLGTYVLFRQQAAQADDKHRQMLPGSCER
eukprot:scaffold40659_cov71-Phaeocystis_antarctica.AAC.5